MIIWMNCLMKRSKSISNMEELIKRDPTNPFYKELIGEILFGFLKSL